tara:strand:- start:60 stop:947 length:888 start_codon:yes stop_codon:yes gene_type:complete
MNPFTGLKPEEGDNIEINNPKECKRAEKKLKIINEKIEKCECEDRKEYLLTKKRILEILINEYENRDKGIPVKKDKPKNEVKEEFVFNKEEIDNYNEKRKRENKLKEEAECEERKEREEKSREYWGKWENIYNNWNNEEKARKLKRDEELHQKYKQQQQGKEQEQEQEQQEKQKEQEKQSRQQKRRQQRQQGKQQRKQEKQEKQQRSNKKNKREDNIKSPVDLKPFIEEFNMKLKDVPNDIMNLNHNFTLEEYKKLSRTYHPDKLSGKQDFMYILNEIRDHYIKREVNHDETWTK